MSRFEVVKEIASNQNYELLENHLHEDSYSFQSYGHVIPKVSLLSPNVESFGYLSLSCEIYHASLIVHVS